MSKLAARVLRRLVARYGADIVIVHGNEPGVDASFKNAAKELGVATELRIIDRNQTGHPTIGQKNCELFSGGADMCLVIHKQAGSCSRTLDCVRQALQRGIPVYLIENDRAIPIPLHRHDRRLFPP